MLKLINIIKRIFRRSYHFDKLTNKELNCVVGQIITKIKESDYELF